jgi:porin
MLAELDWRTNLGGEQNGLPGIWRFGGWRNTARYQDVFLSIDGAQQLLGSDTAALQSSVSGSYFMGQQQLTRNAVDGGLSVFGNVVQADPRTDLVDQMISVGLLYDGPFAARPNDRLGFAIGRDRVSGRIAHAERLVNQAGLGTVPVQGYEYITELNYQLQLPRGMALMPNVQYIHHPGGTSANHDATVWGLRVVAKF